MLLLVLFLLLQETTALPIATCDGLLAETQTISDRLRDARRFDGVMPDDLLRQFAARAREARRCYDGRAPEHLGLLYRRELYALRWLRRYEEAIHVASEALSQDALSPAERAYLYYDRANAHARLGRSVEALHDYVEALARTPEHDAEQRASLLIEMGFNSRQLRDVTAATSYYRQAEQLLRSRPAVDRSRLAFLLRQKADLALTSAENDSLLEAGLRDALEAAQLYLESGSANLLYNAGTAYLTASQLSDALGDATQAIELARRAETFGQRTRSSLLLAGALRTLATLEARRGRMQVAHTHLLDALDHARQAGYTEYEMVIARALGDLELGRQHLAAAKDWYQQAIRHAETLRASLGTTDWSVMAFDQWQGPYTGLVRVLLAEGRTQEAFLTLEQTRARHLRDLHRQAQLMGDLSDHDRLRVDSLSQQLVEVRNQLSRPSSPDALTRLKLRETRLMTELDAVLDLEPQATLLPLPQLHAALRERGQVLISYFVDPADPVFGVPAFTFAFVLTPETVTGVTLDVSADSLETLMASISPLFRARPGERQEEPPSLPTSGLTFRSQTTPGLRERQFDTDALFRLHQALIAPLQPYLPERGRLVVVPDGLLFMIPFGMLLEAKTPAFSYEEAPFLVRRYALSTELAASMLLRPNPPDRDLSLDVAAFGRTRFDEPDLGALPGRAPLPDLPAVADELAGIRSLFRQTRIAQDAEATETVFYRLMNEPTALHLASHALTSPSPLYNAIVLWPDAETDGVLFFHELKRHRLSTPLVVLSGCSTADGTLAFGEGMQSLQYAFHATGVSSSVATLWLVDDRAMSRIMETFYRHLRDGLPKDVALQRAQLDYLEAAPASAQSPFFWAAPVLYGDPHPLHLSRPLPWGWLLGLLALVALLPFLFRTVRSSLSV
ncbi:hypothetical protein AWN76_012690 [Rhodothermaceae bacterium RA]|nr:hypothetical protein AWN76_012690 [Rhodothermaceae bacterium RA]